MPSLTYMLVHDNMAGREKSWDAFRTDAEWKKVSSTPGSPTPTSCPTSRRCICDRPPTRKFDEA